MINKELVSKYKNEFEHWLTDGKLLCQYTTNKGWWQEVSNDDEFIWTKPPENVIIIINDEFADIKKTYYANELERLEYFTLLHKWEDWIEYKNSYDETQVKNGLSIGFIDDYPITRPQMFRLKLN